MPTAHAGGPARGRPRSASSAIARWRATHSAFSLLSVLSSLRAPALRSAAVMSSGIERIVVMRPNGAILFGTLAVVGTIGSASRGTRAGARSGAADTTSAPHHAAGTTSAAHREAGTTSAPSRGGYDFRSPSRGGYDFRSHHGAGTTSAHHREAGTTSAHHRAAVRLPLTIARRIRLPLTVAGRVRLPLTITRRSTTSAHQSRGGFSALTITRRHRLPLTIARRVRLPLTIARRIRLPLPSEADTTSARGACRPRASDTASCRRPMLEGDADRSDAPTRGRFGRRAAPGLPSLDPSGCPLSGQSRLLTRNGHPAWVAISRKKSGGVLLSHRVPPAVPSAQRVLASGFGM